MKLAVRSNPFVSEISPLMVRVLVFIYMEQVSWVRWGDARSSQFRISNGTRQGAILSPIFWTIYSDPLLRCLRALGLGAHVAGLFMGAVCYADDVLLIAPTRSAMQRMLFEIQVFAEESNILFSTDPIPAKSKTKCIYVVGSKKNLSKPAPLMLCGRELPYVKQADHLGNMLTEQGDMEQDAVIKRAKFIQSSVEIRETFKFAAPEEIIRCLKVYSNSFYGSSLWNLGGDKAKQVFNAWSTTIKLVWSYPQQTRSYFLQQLLCCGHYSARTDILTRFVKFFHGLRASASHEVQVLSRFLARDLRSVTGRNLCLVHELTNLNPWEVQYGRLRAALHAEETVAVPDQDRWRIQYLASLLRQRGEAYYNVLENEVEALTDLVNSLVTN